MTEDNGNSYGSKDELDDCVDQKELKEDKKILERKSLQTLLDCFTDIGGKYPLSAVLRRAREEYGFEEDELLQGILQLSREERIIISSKLAQKEAENNPSISVEQLMESKDYDNILIAFREQENKILLRNVVEANVFMLGMQTQFDKIEQKISMVEQSWNKYNEREQKSEGLYNKFSQTYQDFEDEKAAWDKHQKDFEGKLEKDREDILKEVKEEAKKEAKKGAKEIIEEELLQSGKIGSALHDAQRNIIQFMAIFVAVFSLVSINVTNAGKWNYAELFRVNVIMTTAMFSLVTLIHIFTSENKKWLIRMGLTVAIMWLALAFSTGVSMYYHWCNG